MLSTLKVSFFPKLLCSRTTVLLMLLIIVVGLTLGEGGGVGATFRGDIGGEGAMAGIGGGCEGGVGK